MIQTDEQRRWWFATHPEFSRSSTGGKSRGIRDKGEGNKVRPEDVDAYVDEHLQYVSGPVAALLKSVKRHFGTEGASGNGEPHYDPRFMVAQFQPLTNFGLRTNPMPTMDDLLRMPEKPFKEFLRWINSLSERFPLLIDPNALEKHHELVRELADYFAKLDFEIEDFIEILTFAEHRQKGTGVHSRKGEEKGTGRGGDWNAEWRKFKADNPIPENMSEIQKEAIRRNVKKKRDEMRERYYEKK